MVLVITFGSRMWCVGFRTLRLDHGGVADGRCNQYQRNVFSGRSGDGLRSAFRLGGLRLVQAGAWR